MPYKTFNSWLFDGSRNTPIPKRKDGVDILKYNSPITHTYVLSIFLRNGPLNHYLNKYFNNIGLRYLSKEDLFKFVKKCVLDFRFSRRDMVYYPYKRKTKLFEVLRNKVPHLKNCDIATLCELVEKSEDKEMIYESLAIAKPKKQKLSKAKKPQGKKIPLDKFLKEHFSMIKS